MPPPPPVTPSLPGSAFSRLVAQYTSCYTRKGIICNIHSFLSSNPSNSPTPSTAQPGSSSSTQTTSSTLETPSNPTTPTHRPTLTPVRPPPLLISPSPLHLVSRLPLIGRLPPISMSLWSVVNTSSTCLPPPHHGTLNHPTPVPSPTTPSSTHTFIIWSASRVPTIPLRSLLRLAFSEYINENNLINNPHPPLPQEEQDTSLMDVDAEDKGEELQWLLKSSEKGQQPIPNRRRTQQSQLGPRAPLKDITNDHIIHNPQHSIKQSTLSGHGTCRYHRFTSYLLSTIHQHHHLPFLQ